MHSSKTHPTSYVSDRNFWSRRWSKIMFTAACVLVIYGSFVGVGIAVPPISSARSAPSRDGKQANSRISKFIPSSLSSVPHFATNDIFNSTLGFGAIILISLPSRTDRRDAMSLIAASQDIKITTVINGVKASDIADKAKPIGKGKEYLSGGEMGAWRSHIDAFKWIVDQRIETALILEDDVDWDIYLKEELHFFAQGLRASDIRTTPWTTDEFARSPYGTDWDVLHLGPALIDSAPPPFSSVAMKYTDPHRNPANCVDDPSWGNWYCFDSVLADTRTAITDRAIVPSYKSVGLAALAVTNLGAQRLIYEASWKGLDKGIDWTINDALANGTIRGWTPAPPIFSSWKVEGPADSDLKDMIAWGEEKTNLVHGHSPGLMYSSRAALTKTLVREDEYWSKDRFGTAAEEDTEEGLTAEPQAAVEDPQVDAETPKRRRSRRSGNF